jgi:hypothetical protein
MVKKIKLITLIFFLCCLAVGANLAWAADFGTNAVSTGLAGTLTTADPRFLAGRIVQIALSFLGVIAVLIVMYAGFLWMSSDGDEEKIRTAKGILRNGVIGLAIILASWGIATYIINRLVGNSGSVFAPSVRMQGLSTSGIGAIGNCTVDSTYPSNNQTDLPRNTSIMITFKEELKLDSVCVDNAGAACACNNSTCNKINPLAVRLYKTDLGDACTDSCPATNSNVIDLLVNVASGNKTLVLIPANPLGSSDGNVAYSIKFTNQVKKLDNSSMFKNCNTDFVQWNFTVNNKFDLTPPIVNLSGVFPNPDNLPDVYEETAQPRVAAGAITVASCPNVYRAATVKSVVPVGSTTPQGAMSGSVESLEYKGALTQLKITVPAAFPGKAQLFDSSNNLLGAADFDTSGKVVLSGYLTFRAPSHPAGSLWLINISPEQLADTLTVNDQTYTFAAASVNNHIKVPSTCASGNLSDQASEIEAVISGQPDFNVNLSGNTINLSAKVAGLNGNNLVLTTSNPSALTIHPMSGGQERQAAYLVKDKPDKPMNSAIQINFNEAINPMTVSGPAATVANYLKVVNANASSSPQGAACNDDSDCRSYNCVAGACVSNYLSGNFAISNGYKTVEFISDKECGFNACGEKIYCLPKNGHLAVELVAAGLKSCGSNSDCSLFAPFQTCSSTPLGYSTCQNQAGKNYPQTNLNSSSGLNGIVDAALNSLDGDRDTFADGPVSFYNDNNSSILNLGKQDNYLWSFYISDQIKSDPPKITAIKPNQGRNSTNLVDPIEIKFDTLMLNSTLRTGSTLISNGSSTFEHKLINLSSLSLSPLGYWISGDNQDSNSDGEPDITVTNITHSPFAESVTYKSQVGSGVKDIYQNCYKPSVGPDCAATPDQPSCCFGAPVSSLGADGNCH